MTELLAGSPIVASHRHDDPRVQDAYSLRCAPQVNGAARDTWTHVEAVAAAELRSAIDNPVVLPDGRVESCGNFHGAPVAMACDFLAIAAAEVGAIAERRTDRMLDPARSYGLPPFLTEDAGVNSGLMLAQYTQAAMVAENRRLAVPASTDSLPTSAMQEDHVSMGWGAARKLRTRGREPRAASSPWSSPARRGRSTCARRSSPGPGTAAALRRGARGGAGPGPGPLAGAGAGGGGGARELAARCVEAVEERDREHSSERPAPVHAPRGAELSCRGWPQEAAMRMLMNNLDPDVAERPDELVVYGGTGQGGAVVGGLRRARAHAPHARRRRDDARPVRASRWACSARTSGRRAC